LRKYDLLVIYDCGIDIIELYKDGKITDAEAKLLIDGQKPDFWDIKDRNKKKQNFDKFARLINN